MKGKENTRLKRRRISTSGRKPPCTLLHTAVQARKVVLRNRWSGIVLGYRRVSAQNCPSFPCSASRSRLRAHWFERAGSYVNIRRIEYTVHSDRIRCAFLRTIGMCPLESLLYRFIVSFDTRGYRWSDQFALASESRSRRAIVACALVKLRTYK